MSRGLFEATRNPIPVQSDETVLVVMEWREQSAVGSDEAYLEARRWIEAATEKAFGSEDFRAALEDGVLLCDLINRIKPGTIRRVNRLPTPIAGLDNLNVFLKAGRKLGLKEAQLFHPGDLQDLSTRVTVKHQETNRRLKNVLITIFWLGRRAQCERGYDGPHLNLKAFEGLLGTALFKALQESSSQKGGSVRDSGFGDSWYSEREEVVQLRGGGGGGGRGGHRRDDSLDSLDSLGSRPRSISSDATLKGGSEGCCSDAEADAVLRMDDNRSGLSYRRSVTITPKASGPFNQFLPTKDKASGYVPAPLRKKRAERQEDSRRSWVGPAYDEDEGTLSSEAMLSPDCYGDTRAPWGASPLPPPQWADEYGSGSDSDADRPDPDLVLDDLASRRFHSPSPAPPTNFAVPISPTAAAAGGRPSSGGGGAGGGPWPKVAHVTPQQNVTFLSGGGGVETLPPQQGSVTVDHRRPVSSDSLFRETYGDSEDEDDDDVGYADPVQDDLYSRKMGIKPQPVAKQSYDKFLPKFWTPDEDVHVQKIKLGSQTRPWYKKMQGFRQRTESVDGSKSTSDILVERQDRYEELQRFREQTKETEDQWQDDLSKWKNRRRSVNSDIVKKKEERDHIEQITGGGGRRSKTFKEMQEERETKGRNSIGGRLGSLSYLDDEDVFNAPVVAPRTRTLPARSYTIDTPYSSSEPPEPVLKEADPPSAAASPAPPPAPRGSDTVDRPAGRDATTAIGLRSAAPPHRSPERPVKTEASSTAASLEKEPRPRLPLSRTQPEAEAPSSGFLHKQPPPPQQQQTASMEARPPGVSRVSASLPRSYQRSDSARLTSVVAPRPFGAQSSRLTSLPRALTVDDPQKRVNGDADVSRKSAVPSRYHQFMTSEDEAHSQTSSARSTEDEEEEEEVKTAVKTVSPVKPESPVGPAPPKETSQENCREMRISLNQKPNSSKDFGFQAVWDSTGARVTSIQPGSPAEMCQLQVGDEVLTLNGQQVADMSYVAWKSSMEEALQEGSLIIDIRHRGNNNWDRDPTSLPFKSHKTINLTSTDHPILLGSHDNNAVGSSLDFTSRRSTAVKPLPPVQEAAARPLLDAASNGVNGGFREPPVTLRNKESEPISLKNLKRRSEFFEKGGSESVMPDIPVPPLTLTSSRWSWDPEEERKRQEKWQKEQERILQEKYKRDQEKLQEEWLKDQEEIARSTDPPEPVSLEVNRHIISPHSPRSPLNQPPWEEEEEEERKREEEEEELQRKVEEERQRQVEVERQRQVEVERQRQAEVERQRQAEERRKREEEERELQRLREERQRKERQEEVERKMVAEEELRWQKRREEEREAERRQQEAAEQQRRDQWMKSKSCSQLDEEEAPQRKGGGVAQWLLEGMARTAADREARRAAAELETERRNIRNAMRYREPERVTGGGGLAEKKGLQSGSHAELERQQILNEMKKKTPLLMDRSWIRQRSAAAAAEPDAGGVKESDMPPIRRGESLDNLDSYNSWRSSWTPRTSSVSHVQNYARPHSALSGAPRPGSSSTLPSSSSMGSLRGGAGTPSSPWSQQSSTSSPTATSPEPTSEGPQQRNRSVSGKKICTFCDAALGKGAAMIIESLGLCYHLGCFKCIDCKSDLGGSQAGAEVRIRNKQLYCNSCYVRFKAGQPTSM